MSDNTNNGLKEAIRPKRLSAVQPAGNILTRSAQNVKKFVIKKDIARNAWKVGIYGEPGVGKSTFAALCQDIIVADLEHGMLDLNVARVEGIQTWEDLRDWVKSVDNPGRYCIDSMSTAEDLCADYIIRTKVDNSGIKATTSIEDFKYKAGAKFVADEFRRLLMDIENSFMKGSTWVMLAHNRVSVFNNPDDRNYIMHAPDLLDAKDASNKAEWVRFCDHVLYIGRDIVVSHGKAIGGEKRTIYMDNVSSRVCKQRGLNIDILEWNDKSDDTFWKMLKLNK